MEGYGICEKSNPVIPGAGLNLAVAGEMRTVGTASEQCNGHDQK